MLSSIVHAACARSSFLSALRRSWRHPPLLHPWGRWRSLVLEPFTASGGWISSPWAAPWWPPPLVRHTSSEVPSSSPLAPHSRGITELAIDGRSASLYKGRPVRRCAERFGEPSSEPHGRRLLGLRGRA